MANVDATAVVALPTGIWFGGDLALSATVPLGYKKVAAGLDVISPQFGTAIRLEQGGDVFTIGDPVVSGMLGWHHRNFHWQTGVMVNVPIDDYQDGELANISFNHWGADVYASAIMDRA